MSQKMRMLFSGANTYIHVAEYISGDGWWLDRDGSVWWNRRDHFKHNAVYLCKVGSFDLCINGEWCHVQPGTVVFIPAGSDLEFYFDGNGPLEKYYIHFDLMFGDSQLSDYFSVPYVFMPSDGDTIEKIFADLLRCCAVDGAVEQLAANGLLLTLVAEILRQSGAKFIRTPERLDAEMRDTVEYINAHFGENLSVSALATRVGYSPTYFTKKFKKTFGCTLTNYVVNVRLRYAKMWLATGDMSISAIASALGFCDTSYFSNFFKAKTGLFPGYYRKNKQE